ncbi:MAG: LLM class flavin-dependent oxidoreductase [Comamonadaceae bacterium]|nr:MAG: LLM class flavin-dependent oxidoreductase [Comamonadaceae bacterium]
MHVGMTVTFQNLDDKHTDEEVYKHELGMADMAEPLGFDSIWAAEHHFNGYTMCPNVTQFLTYMAGRTKRVKLGSMVSVLPWHDPVRVAEEVSVLDHMSGGRAILGIGRGLGRIEFDGFRVPMGESRERFVASASAILRSLETGYLYSDDPVYQQPKVQIRPMPMQTFRGRTYAAAVSPESARIMAKLGIGLLVIAQKPWDKTLAELQMYRSIYREINNCEPPKPIMACWIACHEDEDTATMMYEKYVRRYSRSALEHYEFHNEGLADIKGYEYYGALANNIAKHGVDAFVEFLANLQIRGTPDQVYAKLMEYAELVDAEAVLGVFSYGGMPFEMARENQRLFADKVMPRLKDQRVLAEA